MDSSSGKSIKKQKDLSPYQANLQMQDIAASEHVPVSH